MNRKFDKTLIITTLVCLLPLILSAFLYPKLPDQVPIHFDLHGTPDSYASKAIGAFVLPLLLALSNVVLQLILNNDPKRREDDFVRELSKWILPIFSFLLVPTTLFIALGYNIRIERILPIAISLLFLVIGNYLPKCRQNYTVGIKIPWTLASEENWNRTHRFAGWLWSGASIIMLIASLGGWAFGWVGLVCILTMVIAPIIYSFLYYKKTEKKKNHSNDIS